MWHFYNNLDNLYKKLYMNPKITGIYERSRLLPSRFQPETLILTDNIKADILKLSSTEVKPQTALSSQ